MRTKPKKPLSFLPYLSGIALLGLLAGLLAMVGPGASSTMASATSAVQAPKASVDRNGRALRVMVVGDSLGGALAVGLAQVEKKYHARIINESVPGCALPLVGNLKVLLFQSLPPNKPCGIDNPQGLLNFWSRQITQWNPDVVVYFARAEIYNQQLQGRWTHIGLPGFDAWERTRLDAGETVLTAKGAGLVVVPSLTSNSGEAADGSRLPEDDPARAVRALQIFSAMATDHRMTTSMVNIGSVLTPNLTSPNQIGGTVIRCPDRIHLAPGAGVLVAPMVFTAAWERGAAHRTTHPILAPAEIPFPPSQPEWYNKLHC